MKDTEILVGTDGSAAGTAAVQWAADEARRRGAALRILHAFDWEYAAARFEGGEVQRAWARDRSDATIAAAVVQAREVAPDLTVREEVVLGRPAPSLVEAANRAALVVVGNRGRGGFGSLLLGSVSQHVATHAPCPTVVVRGRRDIAAGPVVVGFDGTAPSIEALELALRAATERKAPVVAVRAYAPPAIPPWGIGVEPYIYDTKRFDADLHAEMDEQLAPWREKYPDVAIEAVVGHGSPAGVLVGVSHTAQLVVVGNRGHGGLAGTLLGSVGLQLLHHADCPVLIARTAAPA